MQAIGHEMETLNILSIVLPLVMLSIGLITWARAIYERGDSKREKLVERIEGLTTENVTLKAENLELKRMNAEWRDLANRYHSLAVKYYKLSRLSVESVGSAAVVTTTTVASVTDPIPTPDEVFDDKELLLDDGS